MLRFHLFPLQKADKREDWKSDREAKAGSVGFADKIRGAGVSEGRISGAVVFRWGRRLHFVLRLLDA